MHATDVIAYTADAAVYCPRCAVAHYPGCDRLDVEDSEGNVVHPVFAVDAEAFVNDVCDVCYADIWPR